MPRQDVREKKLLSNWWYKNLYAMSLGGGIDKW